MVDSNASVVFDTLIPFAQMAAVEQYMAMNRQVITDMTKASIALPFALINARYDSYIINYSVAQLLFNGLLTRRSSLSLLLNGHSSITLTESSLISC